MSKSIRIEVPQAKERNPLFLLGGKGTGGQKFRDRRDRRSKDARRSWKRDHQENG